jgi:lysophospholipase L1-like esterase
VNVVPTDSRAYLAAFYAALDSAASMPVRVVHYGDSQIEEDRITNILRENWQKQYGGGGVGLIPLHQTIPTRSIRQTLSINGVIQTSQKGPQRYIVYGPKSMRLTDSDDYGVMGQVAILDSTLVPGSDSVVLHVEPLDKKRKTYHYFSHVRVLADSSLTASLSPLLDSTTHCDITLQGRGKVYGVSLETDKGVVVDNIPMRGCSGNIFTKIDSTQLSDFYRETNTRLIILQFGGNMIPQTENPTTIRGYVRSTMRQQVRYIRSCAPQASILFIGPSDMSTNIDGTMTTYPLVPYMDQLLRKMAQEEGIAYWSIYDAMGGKDSMVRWVENGLAGSDYVHFTRAGANNIGKKLFNWIEARGQ